MLWVGFSVCVCALATNSITLPLLHYAIRVMDGLVFWNTNTRAHTCSTKNVIYTIMAPQFRTFNESDESTFGWTDSWTRVTCLRCARSDSVTRLSCHTCCSSHTGGWKQTKLISIRRNRRAEDKTRELLAVVNNDNAQAALNSNHRNVLKPWYENECGNNHNYGDSSHFVAKTFKKHLRSNVTCWLISFFNGIIE